MPSSRPLSSTRTAVRLRNLRAAETQEQRSSRRAANRERSAARNAAESADQRAVRRAARRAAAASRKRHKSGLPESNMDQSWPQYLLQNEKLEIAKEFYQATSATALAMSECSFCGRNEMTSRVTTYPVGTLDISLLKSTVELLRAKYGTLGHWNSSRNL